MSSNEVILHCQKQLKRELSDEKILHYLRRLARIKITIGLLEQTGIGRSVNQLSRNDGIIGHESRKLVRKWKKIVEEQKQLQEENSNSPSSTPENRSECDDDDDDNELVIDQDQDQNHIEEDRDNEITIKAEAEESDNEDYEDKVNKCWNNESEDENENELVNNENQYVPPIKAELPSNSDNQNSSEEGEEFVKFTKKQQTENLPYIKIEHESNSDDSNNDYEKVVKMNKRNEKKSRKSKHHKDYSDDSDNSSKNVDTNIKIKLEEKSDSDDRVENEKEKKRKSHKSRTREHEKEKVDYNHNHKHRKEKSKSKDKDHSEDKIDHSDSKKRKKNHEVNSVEISSKKVKSHTDTIVENGIDLNMKSKIIKKEIDSTSGFNFSDVMGSLYEANGSKSKTKNIGPSSSNGKKTSTNKTSSKNSVIMSSSSQMVNGSNKNENKKDSQEKVLSKSPAKLKPKPSIENLIRSSSPKYVPNLAMSFSQETDKNKNNQQHDMSLDLDVDDHFISECKPVSNYKPVITNKVNYDALSSMITSRKERTKVYSGHKTNYFTGEVPKLFDMCLQTIHENIDQLGYTGGVPYEILEPVFSKITAQQLLNVEEYNTYIIESSDELWEFHCKRDFRGKSPEEFETWREFYLRSIDERESKLASLTSKVKKTQAHATPIRKAKLAYFENTTTSNYNKNKAATIKNGMKTLKHRENKESQARSRLENETNSSQMPSTSKKSSSSESNKKNGMVDEVSSVIIRNDSKASSAPAPPKERESKAISVKPKKAPLMQKTLRIMKTLYRR